MSDTPTGIKKWKRLKQPNSLFISVIQYQNVVVLSFYLAFEFLIIIPTLRLHAQTKNAKLKEDPVYDGFAGKEERRRQNNKRRNGDDAGADLTTSVRALISQSDWTSSAMNSGVKTSFFVLRDSSSSFQLRWSSSLGSGLRRSWSLSLRRNLHTAGLWKTNDWISERE